MPKDFMKQIFDRSVALTKKIDKENKNNPAYPKCDKFCNNEYINKTTKNTKRVMKLFKRKFKQTKQDRKYAIQVCKKSYCNPKCDGYKYYMSDQIYKDFSKKIKNGYTKKYTPAEIEKLKKKGTISACVNDVNFKL